MLRALLSAPAFVMLCHTAMGQGFINTYGGWLAQDATGIVPSANGFRVATRYLGSIGPVYQAHLLSLDPAGALPAWEPMPGVGNNAFVQAMCAGIASTAFIAGSIIPADASTHDGLLVKLEASGAVAWIAQPELAGDEQYFCVESVPDGGAIAAGVRAAGAGHDVWVTRFTANGNVLWSTSLGSTLDEEAYGVSVQGNDIMLTGRQVNFGGTTDAWFARLDLAGNALMTTSWGGADDEIGRAIKPIGPGTFLMAGSTLSLGMFDQTEQRTKESVYLIAIDLNGDTLWTKAVGDTLYDRRAFGLDIAPNGDALICGERSGVTGESDALAYRTTNTGTTVWERAWDLGKEERLLAMLALPDGFISTGWTFDASARQVLLVRRDPNGN
ncbi:MAG: hypothetical protein IPL52_04085 [Flavobacteriales bacterium]|nr:hypothetical protein [Flavobacteriales bacterium]